MYDVLSNSVFLSFEKRVTFYPSVIMGRIVSNKFLTHPLKHDEKISTTCHLKVFNMQLLAPNVLRGTANMIDQTRRSNLWDTYMLTVHDVFHNLFLQAETSIVIKNVLKIEIHVNGERCFFQFSYFSCSSNCTGFLKGRILHNPFYDSSPMKFWLKLLCFVFIHGSESSLL